jgi:hypothetical protein
VPNVGGMVLNGRDGMADTVARQWVTASIFDALGVTAIAGRTFDITDDTQQRNVVVLAEAFWRERFDGDRSIVGREIRLDGSPYTMVGVVPREAQVLGRTRMLFIGVVGLVLLMGRLIATMLFGVRPGDPVTYVAVAMLLLLGAVASAIGPAWRAARVEPALALRHD